MRLTAALALTTSALLDSALAIDMPARKPGLWEMKISMEGRATAMPTVQHCIDAVTDKQMNTMGGGMTAEQCSKKDVQRSGTTVTVDSVCNIGGGVTATSHAVVSGDFNSSYSVKVHSKREGGQVRPGIPAETDMMVEAKWLGACTADQKPGDMIMGNGMKMNINEMAKGGVPPGMKR